MSSHLHDHRSSRKRTHSETNNNNNEQEEEKTLVPSTRDNSNTSIKRHHHHHHHRHHNHSSKPRTNPETSNELPSYPLLLLPYNAPQLETSHLQQEKFTALFAHYLDVQKTLDFSTLSSREIKGRWKSFLRKWNGNLLPRGWYDPDLLLLSVGVERGGSFAGAGAAATRNGDGERKKGRQRDSSNEQPRDLRQEENNHDHHDSDDDSSNNPEDENENNSNNNKDNDINNNDDDDDDDDDDTDLGPALPSNLNPKPNNKKKDNDFSQLRGPTIPSFDDLQSRQDDKNLERSKYSSELRSQRKKYFRQQEKDFQEEVLPARAQPGSKERQLEKKRELAAVNREFRDHHTNRGLGEMEDIKEKDLMGGGDGDEEGIDEYKARVKTKERQKNEREIRKEEVLRARAAEREEKIRVNRLKEDKTMEMLKEIARQRFGGGGGSKIAELRTDELG